MAATHAAATSIAIGSTNTAGSTKTGTVIDLTACYGAGVTAQIKNGATGPTVGATVNVYVSNDNSAFRLLYTVTAGVANNGQYDFAFNIDPWWMYLRVDVTGNTAQTVTCEALVHTLTGL